MAKNIFKYIPFVFSVFKTFLSHSRHSHKVKNFDKTSDKIDTIEHLLVKLERKVNECRNEIEELRAIVLFSRALIIILLILITFLIIFLR